ncbi:MAG: HAD family hydrolase [Defluviitaleaceae bacterium]|nr:HAD family hydrolase [Defluviitaleaceae bacterium]
MEIINPDYPRNPVRAVLFDFDGTFSTLRDGWEGIMQPLMLELLGAECEGLVTAYISESTGIQTIHQMKWLAAQVEKRYGNAKDPWEYKAEYNRRLMETVEARRRNINKGEDYLIPGSLPLILALRKMGAELYIASGTDEPDVRAEAEALGIARYFNKIAGAPKGAENCAKEDVIRGILHSGDAFINGEQLAVVGDGKVEIAIGRENGTRTLGIARNAETRERLIKAGADSIAADFTDLQTLMKFFKGEDISA